MTGGEIDITGNSAVSGLWAQTSGSGLAAVRVTGGTVSTLGKGGHGVGANSTAGATLVLIDAEVTGGSDAGYGVYTATALGQMSTITIDSNAVLSAASGLAIFNNGGDSTTQIIAGASVSGEINLGHGNDLLTIDGVDINNITVMNGGDDISDADGFIDVLTISNVTVTNTQTWRNWEVVNLDNVVLGDLNSCNGDLSLGDVSSAGNVYGCKESENFTVTDMAEIAGVLEGAGGADRIEVLGGASVATINGGGEGSDMSAADDAGDLIIINTTGTIGTVMGGDDGGIADGVSGDRIEWLAGTITNGIYGGDGSDHVLISAAEYDGTQILDGGDGTTATDGMVDTLELLEVDVEVNGADILNWEIVSLDGSALTIVDRAWAVGDVTDPTTGVWLAQGSILDQSGINLVLTGNLQIADATSSFQGFGGGIGVYDFTGNLTNNGVLTTRDDAVGDMITVGGDYAGVGQFWVDVELGDDTSMADKLVVAGSTSGTTKVFVNNVGGTGAQTATGILLVDVGDPGASTGEFLLANGDYTIESTGETAIIAGAYGYALRDIDGDWFLQSELNDQTPIWQPGAPIYEVLPSALFGLNRVGTLAQRIEGRQMLTRGGDAGVTVSSRGTMAQTPSLTGGWLRIEGERLDVTPNVSTSGVSFDQSAWRLQGGLDMAVYEGDRGTWVAGLNLFTGGSSVDVASTVGGGDISTDAQGVGLTATFYGNSGFYADVQLQYSNFESNLSSSVLGSLVSDLDGEGRLASIEMGQEFDLPNGMTLTPQAQLTSSEVSFDSFTGPSGEMVSLGSADSLQLRLGVAAEQSWDIGNGEQARLYGIVNVTHEMRGETRVLVDGTTLAMSAPDWVGEIGLGGSYDWSSPEGLRTSLYGEVSASRALSAGSLTGLSGTIGVRMEW